VAAKTATPVKEDVAPATEMTATAASEVAAPIKLVEDTIIKDALPATDSLAKEEIYKLDDIHTQLKDQQQEIKQQHTDVDTLLQLKEEQIKLLESQLAAQNHS
jgi:ATP-dependent exoDNAse (exonuclease V) alpha subunit